MTFARFLLVAGALMAGCLAAHAKSVDDRLIDAANSHDLAGVKAALADGARINTPNGPTALFRTLNPVSASSPSRNLNEFVQHGTDFYENGDAIVRLLLEHGADINAPGPDHRTALQKVLIYDGADNEVIPDFADHHPDLNLTGSRGEGLVAMVLGRGIMAPPKIKITLPDQAPVILADDLYLPRKFIEAGASVDRPDDEGVTPMMSVAEYRINGDTAPLYLDFIRLLLAKGADPYRLDHKGRSAADYAIQQGNYQVLLLVDPQRKHAAQYKEVRRQESSQELEYVLLTLRQPTPAQMSQIVELIRQGADPNAKMTTNVVAGNTLFGEVVCIATAAPDPKPELQLVGLLLDHGADANLAQPDGTTPYEIALKSPDVLALLKAHGARPTPLLLRTLNASPGEIADINEALLRQLLPHGNVPSDPDIHVYFLSVLDRASGKSVDPDPAFMKRLANIKARLALDSESKGSTDGVFDKQTGERGEALGVGEIRWVADDEVEVEGTWFVSGIGAGTDIYTMKKKDGRWTVVKQKNLLIS